MLKQRTIKIKLEKGSSKGLYEILRNPNYQNSWVTPYGQNGLSVKGSRLGRDFTNPGGPIPIEYIKGYDKNFLNNPNIKRFFVEILPLKYDDNDTTQPSSTTLFIKPTVNPNSSIKFQLNSSEFDIEISSISNIDETKQLKVTLIDEDERGGLIYEIEKPKRKDVLLDGGIGYKITDKTNQSYEFVVQSLIAKKEDDSGDGDDGDGGGGGTELTECDIIEQGISPLFIPSPFYKVYELYCSPYYYEWNENSLQWEIISMDPNPDPEDVGEYPEIKENIIKAIKSSIIDGLAFTPIDIEGSEGFKLTEKERFLQYSFIDKLGNYVPILNWVRGGELQQVNSEIEVLDSIILKLESPLPNNVDLYDLGRIFKTPFLPKSMVLDYSKEDDVVNKISLSPNYKIELDDTTENVFSNFESFNTIIGDSTSTLGKKVVDHFLSEKKIKLNTDFTDFTNFVKFSSAEERLKSFYYKVQQLETYESQSLVISSSSDNAIRKAKQIEVIDDNIRLLKAGFDDYESYLFNTSGSIYSSSFVSSSDGISAEWPKTSTTELVTNGGFSSTSDWNVSGGATSISSGYLNIYPTGIVTQSVSLSSGNTYTLSFDVSYTSLPISVTYNGVTIVKNKVYSIGKNTFEFIASVGDSSNDLIIVADTTSRTSTRIDNFSIKAKPSLKTSTSSDVINWYNSLSTIASDYDKLNRDSFRNNTPEYLREDSNSEDYILFVDMIGVLMDEIWLYGKELSNLYDWNNSVAQGLSEDLSVVLLNMYANNLDVGFSEKDIWEYVLGVTEDNTEIGGLTTDYSFKKQQKETIRRLLTNLPFLLKQKGTKRAIKALVSSYGIPESTLFIREYGTFETPGGYLNSVYETTQNYKLNVSNTTISKTDSSLADIKAIEFNSQWTGDKASTTASFFSTVSGSDGYFSISYVPTASGNYHGYVVYDISSSVGQTIETSSVFNVFSDEITTLFQRVESGSYEALHYSFDRTTGEFSYQVSHSFSVSDAISESIDLTFDNITSFTWNNKFKGTLDEFRIWNSVITDSNFEEHTKYPKSIKLDNPLDIPSSLKVRLGINQPWRNDFSTTIPNLVLNPQYPTTVNVSGVTRDAWISYQRQDYYTSPNIGESLQRSNKVRYQLNQFINGNTLTPNTPMELESLREKIITAEVIVSSTIIRDSAIQYEYRNINKKLITVSEDALTSKRITPIQFIDGTFRIIEGENLITLNILNTEYSNFIGNETKEVIQDVTDINELVVGFSPTEIVNQVIIQHFGGADLVNEYGDPIENYDDRYSSLNTLFDNFFKDLTSNQKAKFFIEYIRNFDKTLFNNIKKFAPEKANLTTAIFIEPNLLDRSKAKRLGKSETTSLANQGTTLPPTYDVGLPSQNTTISNDPAQNDLAPITPLGDPFGDRKSPILANRGIIDSSVISYNPLEGSLNVQRNIPKVIQENEEVGGYSNQSDDVIVFDDSDVDKILISSKWDENNKIVHKDLFDVRRAFEVRKNDFSDRLNEIESEIGALSSDNRTVANKTYSNLIREYNDKKKKHGKLFLIKDSYSGTKPGTTVTSEDYLSYRTLSSVGFGSGRNQARTIIKDGITYVVDEIEASAAGIVNSTKSEKTKKSRVIVSGPDEDIKLTVD